MKGEPDELHIGKLAAQLGLNPKTIRYYEDIGLLPAPRRTASGYRMYDASDRERLCFIVKAKAIGLTLEEIREILALRQKGERPCRHVLHLVDQKVAAVDRQLRTLAEFRRELLGLRGEAARAVTEDGGICHIIEHRELGQPSEPLLPGLGLARRSPRRS